MVKPIAIIPARGGSKRLKNKNILPLVNGKRMIEYPISEALQSGLFEKIIVSTDSDEIALISEKAGAQVISRPYHLSTDTATMVEVCDHVLQANYCEEFCCLYATAALLTRDILLRSHQKFHGSLHPNYVMGVSNYNYSPVQSLKENSLGFLEYMWPEFMELQSQAYPNLVVSNGSFIWAKTKIFLREKTFFGTKLLPFMLSDDEIIDIDTLEDYDKLRKIIQAKEL